MAPSTTAPEVRRYRWTRADYDRVIETGGFGPEDKIELLDGELWEMTPQGSAHSAVCGKVMYALQKAFGEAFFVRVQFPIALDDVSEPEPDVAVVRGAPDDHFDGHPTEALLLVEVSLSSLSFDRGRKLAAYARNGIPEYWVVDLNTEKLEVYREPKGTLYLSATVLNRGDTITPLHAPDAKVRVADLLRQR
jgi:Uma2 family endonuclease